ncbi:hypothetical protein CHCC20335_2781 [Bacillus paralicheniformis]|nr:hypothetical protein CHCC20335_2781 [Bacillus paralicheniformis]
MKKFIAPIAVLLLVALAAGCESWDRMVKDTGKQSEEKRH